MTANDMEFICRFIKKSFFFIVYFVQIFGVGQNINAGCSVIKQKTARGNFYV